MASGDVVYERQSFDVFEYLVSTGSTAPKWTTRLVDSDHAEEVRISGDDNPPANLSATKQYKITITEV